MNLQTLLSRATYKRKITMSRFEKFTRERTLAHKARI